MGTVVPYLSQPPSPVQPTHSILPHSRSHLQEALQRQSISPNPPTVIQPHTRTRSLEQTRSGPTTPDTLQLQHLTSLPVCSIQPLEYAWELRPLTTSTSLVTTDILEQ